MASERLIIGEIKKYYPEDKILSEESGLSSGDRSPGSYIWVIDPLDGTTNFANGYPFFSVSVARGVFNTDGQIDIVLGGVADPIRGRVYLAQKGHGAYVAGQKLSCGKTEDFSQAFLVTGFYYQKGDELKRNIDLFLRVAEKCQNIRRDGSAALDMALVAEGVFDGFWERGLKPWDIAAGSLLINEAGGKIVNFSRNEFDLEGDGVICGSPQALRELKALID